MYLKTRYSWVDLLKETQTASDIVCSVCVSQVTVQFILVCVCSLCNLCVLVHVFLFVASLNACSHKPFLQVPARAGAAAQRSGPTEAESREQHEQWVPAHVNTSAVLCGQMY